MRTRPLGQTGLQVSQLCFGTMTFGQNQWGIGGVTQDEADRLVGRSMEAGINFFDTADVYANGEAEEMLGRALRGRRQGVILATKVRERVGPGPNDSGLSRRHILSAVEASLRRLQTDYIDLYQVHGWDQRTPLEETLRALDDLVRSGKVRYIGLSNFAAWQIARALWISHCSNLERFVSAQMHYSLLCRDIEHEVLPLLLDQRLGLLVWSPLSGGYLSGKYLHEGKGSQGDARPAVRFQDDQFTFPPFDRGLGYRVVDELREIARSLGATPAQVAIAWLLQRPGVTSVIIGARRMEQLEENLKAAELNLPAKVARRLEEMTRPRTLYPNWMIQMQNQDG